MGTFAQNMKATASAIALLATLGLAPGTALANEKHGHGAPAGATTTTAGAVSIVRSPTDLPPPLAKRGPERVRVSLETVEITGQLDDGTTYHYWTFNSKVPGPFVRVRVGADQLPGCLSDSSRAIGPFGILEAV